MDKYTAYEAEKKKLLEKYEGKELMRKLRELAKRMKI